MFIVQTIVFKRSQLFSTITLLSRDTPSIVEIFLISLNSVFFSVLDQFVSPRNLPNVPSRGHVPQVENRWFIVMRLCIPSQRRQIMYFVA
jgi:hypothetical protein